MGGVLVGNPVIAERSEAMPQLRLQNLTLGYDRHPAVHHLDGLVKGGALLAVVGPNGAGKSTLFKAIAGTLKPLAGAIKRDGSDGRGIAYLPQAPDIDRSFPIGVYDMVAMGLWRSRGVLGGIAGKDHHAIKAAIAGRAHGVRAAPDWHAFRRADATHAVCTSRCPGRTSYFARRALRRDRCADLRRPVGSGA